MIRRVSQDLSALFGSVGHPAVSALVYWGCAALAYPLATEGGYGGAVGGAFLFCLAILFLAYWLGTGALAFAIDAKRSCLPGAQRLARRANFLACVLLLPALTLPAAALAWSPVWRAWIPTTLVLGIALAGVLAPLLPVAAVGLLLLVVLAAYSAASGQAVHQRGMELFFAILSATLALAAIAKWRRVIRQGAKPPSLARQLRVNWVRLGHPAIRKLDVRGGASGSRSGEPQSPVQIIQTCLGGAFVQLTLPQLIVGAVLVVVFIVTAIGLPWLGASGWRWAVGTWGVVAAAFVSGRLTQISKLTREQLAELALMPGLGAASAQRRALCRAVLAPPLLWLGMVLLLGSAALLLRGNPLSSVGVLAGCLLTIWLTYTAYALQKLATFPRIRQSFISHFSLFYISVYTPLLLSQIRHWFWWVWSVPVLFSVAILIAIGFSARRLATAPHPFLA